MKIGVNMDSLHLHLRLLYLVLEKARLGAIMWAEWELWGRPKRAIRLVYMSVRLWRLNAEIVRDGGESRPPVEWNY